MEEAIARLRADPVMAASIDAVGEYCLKIRSNKYRALVEVVVAQQLSGHAAGAVLARLRRAYGGRFPTPVQVAETPELELRGVGLSESKARCIGEISRMIESGRLRLGTLARTSDPKVISELTKIRGIGVWTAQMFLIFALGRLDVLPLGDLGVKRAFRKLYGVTEEGGMVALAEAWRPYRTVATWYLWKANSGFGGIG